MTISASARQFVRIIGDGYLKFVDLGRVFKLPTDALSLRVGQFELDLPFSQARSWNLSGWDIMTSRTSAPLPLPERRALTMRSRFRTLRKAWSSAADILTVGITIHWPS